MTTQRFDFQRECVTDTLNATPHLSILNVGCNEDPGNLKTLDPSIVVNCDLFERDAVMDRPNQVDMLFDCARERWPFENNTASLVVLGDILEHLSPEEIEAALTEARRVGRRLCVTVPCDDRDSNTPEQADLMPRGAVHRTIVTEPLLRDALVRTGWTVCDWREVEYDSGAMWGKRVIGYFVSAT
jgi:hypothetical protein